jgi:hypothetical protein
LCVTKKRFAELYVSRRRENMKKITIALVGILAVAFVSCTTSPSGESRFQQAVETAFQNHDISELDKLTCWDRVPEARRKATMELYARDLKFGAKDIELTPPDPRSPDIEWKKDGITYKSNLEVLKNVKITFKEGAKYKDGTYFVGEKEGKLFLLAPAPIEE